VTNGKRGQKKAGNYRKKFLRRIFGPKKYNQIGEYKIRSNNEIKELLREEDVIQTLEGKKMS